jgi:hypothetical protein
MKYSFIGRAADPTRPTVHRRPTIESDAPPSPCGQLDALVEALASLDRWSGELCGPIDPELRESIEDDDISIPGTWPRTRPPRMRVALSSRTIPDGAASGMMRPIGESQRDVRDDDPTG